MDLPRINAAQFYTVPGTAELPEDQTTCWLRVAEKSYLTYCLPIYAEGTCRTRLQALVCFSEFLAADKPPSSSWISLSVPTGNHRSRWASSRNGVTLKNSPQYNLVIRSSMDAVAFPPNGYGIFPSRGTHGSGALTGLLPSLIVPGGAGTIHPVLHPARVAR
jgi:hypothetical protein